MSFVSKKASGKDYPYFRAGGEGQYYLGRPEKPNVQNILKSLDYVKDKSTHYFEVEDKLIAMLPEPERKEYLSKRSAELLARLRRLEEKLSSQKIVRKKTFNLYRSLQQLRNSGALEFDEEKKIWKLKSDLNKMLEEKIRDG
jgi:hypothetical protein